MLHLVHDLCISVLPGPAMTRFRLTESSVCKPASHLTALQAVLSRLWQFVCFCGSCDSFYVAIMLCGWTFNFGILLKQYYLYIMLNFVHQITSSL